MTPYNLSLEKKKKLAAQMQPTVVIVKETESDMTMDENCDMDYEFKEVTNEDEFISVLFAARNTIHLHHLKINGFSAYAGHVALNDLYEDLLDLIDDLAESVQSERLLDLSIPCSKICCEPLDYVSDLLQWIRDYRRLFKYSFQQNMIDEIERIVNKAKYKLTQLK